MENKAHVDGAIRGLLPFCVVGFLSLAAVSFSSPAISGPFAVPAAKLLSHPILYLLSSVWMTWMLFMMGLPTSREMMASLAGGICGAAVILLVVAWQPNFLLSLLILLVISPVVGTIVYGMAYRVGLRSLSP